MTRRPLRLEGEAAREIRDEVARAGGREVAFLAEVTDERLVVRPRAVARGNRSAVLAAARDAPEGGVMIHNHPSGDLEPSHADLAVAARIHEDGLGTVVVDNRAERLYVVVEPPEARVVEPLDVDELADLLAPDGPLASVAGYEDRRGQRDMLRFVGNLYNEGGVGLVEAGTGTGKSLAYLLPAARWALGNGERTVLSTNTINLQEQLVGKDLDLASAVLGEEVPWALVKGRGNYVSIRRARLAAASARTLFPDDRSSELDALLRWLDSTRDGSRSDLPFAPSREVWDEVRSDTDACLRAKCPHFQACHYQRSRRAAAAADLVVVNHALFFSDLAVRIATDNHRAAAVLPAYARVVFDEAHRVEDAATERLGSEVAGSGLLRVLSRLDWGGKGVLASVARAARRVSGSVDAEGAAERILERAVPLVGRLRRATNAFLEAIGPWTVARADGGGLRLGAPPAGKGLESAAPLEPTDDEAVAETLDALLTLIGDASRELSAIAERLDEIDELPSELEGHLLDVQGSAGRLTAAAAALRLCLRPGVDANPIVRWLEVRPGGVRPRAAPPGANVAFCSAPVEIGAVLARHLFARTETAVLTSATLAAGADFSYVKGRLGLSPGERPRVAAARALADGATDAGVGRVDQAIVSSPFDHAAQSCLAVPTSGPSGWGPDAGRGAADVVHDVAELTDGGVLALFTSHSALRAAERRLRDRGVERRWPLFVQGRAPRSRLLADFARSGDAVLLGTSSFWEGVDVAGRPLRALVIQKLPFRPPGDPITQARVEALAARGENGFMRYMVPDAAMRLKQGVGRLIRSRRDRGAVVILDDRIVTRRYGDAILEALPAMPLVQGPWAAVRERVRAFYAEAP